MEENYIEGKSFDKIDYTQKPLKKGEYENCTFINCNFFESDLSNIDFLECEFLACNLSMANLANSGLKGIKFKDSKMLGLRFDTCQKFGFSVNFENCTLNHSSFFQTKLKKKIFKNSQLHEVDFIESDLTSSVFDNCDLSRTRFENTILEKTDFRTSYNYSIDPETNRIKRAKFSASGVIGLLDKYDIEID